MLLNGTSAKSSSLLTQDEVFYTAYEPKVSNRFMCITSYKDGKTFLPTFVAKSLTRPSVFREKLGNGTVGPWTWEPITVECYDPIVPSTAQAFYAYISDPKPFDMKVKVFGPVGDTIEEWEIINPIFITIDFGSLDWGSSAEDKESGNSKIEHINLTRYYKGSGPLVIKATIKYDYAKLNY